jgi:hypothetical protein
MPQGERTQNQFSYESDDTKFPYVVDKYDISQRRIAVFNYSPEYFRKKESSTSGLYQIYGGNIPDDMNSSHSWQFKNRSATPPGPLICTLNKGPAKKLMQFDVLNLNPLSTLNSVDSYHILLEKTEFNQYVSYLCRIRLYNKLFMTVHILILFTYNDIILCSL